MKSSPGTKGAASIILGVLFILFVGTSLAVLETPNKINITGIYGTDSFESNFIISAKEKIDKIDITAGPLIDADDGGKIIHDSNIEISPSIMTDIVENRPKAINVAIKNIPAPGNYSGSIYIDYESNNSEKRSDKIGLLVQAYPVGTSLAVLKKPSQITISGIYGTDFFESNFIISANEKIDEINISAGPLIDADDGGKIIQDSNITISPSNTDIRMNRSKAINVAIKNIPAPGNYSGSLYIDYENNNSEKRSDKIGLLVQAYPAFGFNISSVQPMFKFEKGVWPFSGTGNQSKSLILRDPNSKTTNQTVTKLASEAQISLNELVNDQRKDLFISPDQLQGNIRIVPSGRDLKLNITIANPQAEAGNYSGRIDIWSGQFGSKISVPMVVQVKYPGWLAALIIFLGVIIAYFVTWWNNVGKERNSVEITLARLSRKLNSADISATCRREIDGKIGEIDDFIRRDKFEEAQTKISEADKSIEDCIDKKRKLREKSIEINELLEILGEAEDAIRRMAKDIDHDPNDPAIIKVYLAELKEEIAIERNHIDRDYYPSVSEDLKTRIQNFKDDLKALSSNGGLLDSLKDLDRKIERMADPDDKEKCLKTIRDLKRKMLDSRDKDEVKKLSDTVKDEHNKVDKLRKDQQIIDSLRKNDPHKAEMLRAAILLTDPAQKYDKLHQLSVTMQQDQILSKEDQDRFNIFIESMKLEETTSSRDAKKAAALKNRAPEILEIKSNLKSPQRIGQEIRWEAFARDPDDDAIEYSFSLKAVGETDWQLKRDWSHDKTWTWEPQEIGDYIVQVRVRDRRHDMNLQDDAESQTFIIKDKHPLEKIGNFMRELIPPEFHAPIVGKLIGLALIVVLGVLGYSQLFANNPTFGNHNPPLEYMMLFLWGFGIESSAANVAGVREKFLGSK